MRKKCLKKYKKISDILKDTANCIFVDEYQDTSPSVIRILLDHIGESKKKNVIGFFGDSMQSIYDSGVGSLDKEYGLIKICKTENRRNPRRVIELSNKFRNDEIKQVPSKDINAPNMENGNIRDGVVKFLYGKISNNNDFMDIKNKIFKSFDFSDGEQTKVLRLTHEYNAEMGEFKNLYKLYNKDPIIKLIKNIKSKGNSYENDTLELQYKKELNNINNSEEYGSVYSCIKDMSWETVCKKCKITKESLMSYKLNVINGKYEANFSRDRILRRLDILNELIELWNNNKLNDFLRITKFSINNKEDKVKLNRIIDWLAKENKYTIEEVLKFAEENGLLKEDELFDDYILNEGYYLWNRIKNIAFKEYKQSVDYLKKFLPICTQHSVKGNEYDNVFLILESNWNKYNFLTLFDEGSSNSDVKLRTKKLFYVCITRAKKNLIVYMPCDNFKIDKAKEFFGEENVAHISSI